ncbi:MAG: UvrD-helicase domain-containing protein, partial [Deltaproteobacteria bacterium]
VLRALIEEPRRDISEILVVTFTKAAAEELADRIRRFVSEAYMVFTGILDEKALAEVTPFIRGLGEGRTDEQRSELAETLRNTLLRFDEFSVCTIHSFCKQTLERRAFESGMPFQADFVEDAEQLRMDVARDFWRRRIYMADPLLAAVAVERGWVPESPFLGDHNLWCRYPGTELLPDDDNLEAAVAGLRAACDGAAVVYDRENVEAYFSNVKLNKYKKGQTSEATLADDLDAVERFLVDGDTCEFPALAIFVPEKAKAVIGKGSKAGKERGGGAENQPFFKACQAVGVAAAHLECAMRVSFVREIDSRFEAERRRNVTVTFDDLITLMHEALADDSRCEALQRAVAAQYSIAFIDEFQDTDLVQYEIFHDLFPAGPLFVIGDPKQAIFGFRGADIFAYLRARREAARSYTLGENWRSSRPMVESVNALFTGARRPFAFEEIAFEPARAAKASAKPRLDGDQRLAMHWMLLPPHTSKQKAGWFIERVVADEIVELLGGAVTIDGRPLAPRDIAILVRANVEAERMQAELRRAGVGAVTAGSGDVFASEEARELERVLAAVVAPTGSAATVRAALATRFWGMGAGEIYGLTGDDTAWSRLLDELSQYHEVWLRDGFMPMMARLVTERRVRSKLLGSDGGTRTLTNLMHVIELVQQATHDNALSPHGTLAWLTAERHRALTGSDTRAVESDRRELRLESDADAVKIITLHSAKGLEYEIVFCPYLWESYPTTGKGPVLVHEGAGYERVVLAHDQDEIAARLKKAEAERMSEDLRLLYVGLTRAKQRCYVVAGALGRGGAKSSALRYLVAQPEEIEDGEAAGDDAGDWVERVCWTEKNVDQYMAEVWGRRIRAVVDANKDKMSLSVYESMPARRQWGVQDVDPEQLAPRELGRQGQEDFVRQLKAWWMTSFSAIQSLAREDEPGGTEVELPERSDPAVAPVRTVAQPQPEGIFAFARGPTAGNCLHEIFEHADFAAATAEAGLPDQATRELIAERLANYAFDRVSAHEVAIDPVEVTAAMVGATCGHELPGTGFALRDTDAAARVAEWRFYTPLGGFSPGGLGQVFAGHGRDRIAGEYAARLARLDNREIEGYLSGIVDLLFEHQGRWFIIDWKSNHLGYHIDDYDDAGMWRAMCEHDYVLQYHLYTLALHRYLGARLPGYDYEKHFGGVYYVFLRGINDQGDQGWYCDRPPLALIEALDAAAGMRVAA